MSNSKLGKNVIIYVKGNSFSVHVDNKKNVYPWKGWKDELDAILKIKDAEHSINITKSKKSFF